MIEPMGNTAADVMVAELRARGVTHIATLNGHGLDPFYLACRRAEMRMIDVRNEQSASYMAEITGRLSRRVGVCAVSGAVAHANALTGVLNSHFDGSPMLLITGTTPLADMDWGEFQDFNPVPMAEPICKYARLVDDAHRIGQFVHEAFTAATMGRPGPVHLSLPMDVASAVVDQPLQSGVQSGEVRINGAADPVLIQQAADWIGQAKRPLLVAGSGVYYSRGESALAKIKLPTVVPIWDRGCVNTPLDTYVGVIGAASGGASLLEDADLIVMVGAEFDYRIGQISPPKIHPQAKVIRIHADASRLRNGLEADLSIQASPRAALEQLAKFDLPRFEDWLTETKGRRDAHRKAVLAKPIEGKINARDVVLAVQELLTEETVLLVDAGNIGQWFHQLIGSGIYPGHWSTCGASGVVGWGLPGAMAARLVYPDRPIILLSGDGSFTFTLAELECASRQGLPFVAIVADDEQWGITASSHYESLGFTMYTELGPTRLDQVAEGLNCHGVRIQQIDQLIPAVRDALVANRPTVIQVPIAPGSPAL